ncbi:MAG: hypothetical protein PHC83_03310, partial [Bacteroidales bacterium]|nr:hypothetical protein [Bacteroidales bacterium]
MNIRYNAINSQLAIPQFLPFIRGANEYLYYGTHAFRFAPSGEVRKGFYYDALNRPVTLTQPDGSVITYTYDKGALLQQVASTGSATVSIQNITYNEKEQREDVYYGNTSKTRYYYDPLDFRITRILTTRNTGQDILQDLNYTYDAVGNIVEVDDNVPKTFYFNNQVIQPSNLYQYDALYRLTQAQGRENYDLSSPGD